MRVAARGGHGRLGVALGAPLLVVLALTLAGCGGDGSSASLTPAPGGAGPGPGTGPAAASGSPAATAPALPPPVVEAVLAAPADRVVATADRVRVEEVRLPERAARAAGLAPAARFLRVSVSGDFPPRALPWQVRLGGVDVGSGHVAPDLRSVTAVVATPELAADGTRVAVSYGGRDVVVRTIRVKR